MRFTAFFFVLALPVLPQALDQHGIRTGQVQVAYLVKPVEVSLPAALLSPRQEDLRGAPRQILEFVNTAQANAGGAPISYSLDGRTQVVSASAPVPCVEFENWAEQLLTDYAESVLIGFSEIQWEPGKTVILRFVRDNFRHAYISYVLTIEMLPQAAVYRATFGVSGAPNPSDALTSAGWKVVSPGKFPAPQAVQDGDTIALDLYTDSSTNQKLVDYIHVGKKGQLVLRKEAAHDSYAFDAEFNVVQPRLKVNGAPQESVTPSEQLRGRVLWVDVPGEGRYVLTFQPEPNLGFDRVGEVAGNSITFMFRGNVFHIDSQERIAPGSGTYRVYGRLDVNREAANPNGPTQIVIGSATAIEPVIGR
jgi:hypothetical protein